jgi:hypothetical protein
MRILFVLAVLALAVECEAQDVRIRMAEPLPPPTTFAGLQQLQGARPSGPCAFPSVTLSADSLSSIVLGDSATLRLPRGWQKNPPRPGDHEDTDTQLALPGGSRARIRRELNGAHGRSFLEYRLGEHPAETTCSLDRGQTGAIWSLYVPHPDTTRALRYPAFGDFITPAGFWYNVTLWTTSDADRSRFASIISEAMLLPQR